MQKAITALTMLALLFLGGCATPLGQQYGVIGAAGGAIIGGAATGDIGGAAIGAVIGGLGGGALGDHQTFENQRHRRHQQPYYDRGHRGGYVHPCREMRQPVYDTYGNYVGYRIICR